MAVVFFVKLIILISFVKKILKFKNKLLTHSEFNDIVTGTKNKYACWSKEESVAKKYLTEGSNLICISSYTDLKEGTLVRNYLHVGFYKKLEEFFLINHNTNSNIYFFFIPTDTFTNKDINNIILDIKDMCDKHEATSLESYNHKMEIKLCD
jgi:hypothetical protein